MLEKTIKQVLVKKINEWVSFVDDEKVVTAIKNDLIVTGGCFTSLLNNEPPKDFDCYFRTKDSAKIVAEYYIKKWNGRHEALKTGRGDYANVMLLDGANPSKEILSFYNVKDIKDSKSRMIANTSENRIKIIFPSDGIVGNPEDVRSGEELGFELTSNVASVTGVDEVDEVDAEEVQNQEKEKYFPVFMSTNAITLSNGVQIVVRFYGNPEDIHDTFDYVHTKAYFSYKGTYLSIPKEVYEAVMNKTLIYTGSKYPVCSVFRLRKFLRRGWSINAGQILKMALQISKLDLQNIDTLEDQLVGVDSLYFMNLIHQFRAQQEKDANFDLSTDYVVSIIDKIF
jgi:hypothetical protein